MYGSTLLNTKLSAAISILSGIGFVTVLSIAPVKPPHSKEKNFKEGKEEFPYSNPDKRIMARPENIKKEDEMFFSFKTFREKQEEILNPVWGSEFTNSNVDGGGISLLSFENQIRITQSIRPEINSYYKDETISVNTFGDSRLITNQILEYKYQNKMVENSVIFQNRTSQFKNVEMSYKLNSNFSASFKSTQFDIFDDRLKQYPTTMAGVSFTGSKYLSTGLIAGESTLNNPYRYNQNGTQNSYNFYREAEISFRDIDRANKNLFEWQANITPAKDILFQTAVYNSNKSLINETNVSEGARVAMAVGLKYFVLNLKYNYLADNLLRTITRPDAASLFNKDYAAFGFTFFLDRYKRYSIYLGNNYYNIATSNRPTFSGTNVQGNNSFSASFRGKNLDYFNATFFLNFRNNTNKDYYYSNFGVFRLPVYSQLNLDYATSLGLELSF